MKKIESVRDYKYFRYRFFGMNQWLFDIKSRASRKELLIKFNKGKLCCEDDQLEIDIMKYLHMHKNQKSKEPKKIRFTENEFRHLAMLDVLLFDDDRTGTYLGVPFIIRNDN